MSGWLVRRYSSTTMPSSTVRPVAVARSVQGGGPDAHPDVVGVDPLPVGGADLLDVACSVQRLDADAQVQGDAVLAVQI
jgi:hypothetical protein